MTIIINILFWISTREITGQIIAPVLVQTIGMAHHVIPCAKPRGCTYIFPNCYVPFYKEIAVGIEIIIEDWGNLGADYAKTAGGGGGYYAVDYG